MPIEVKYTRFARRANFPFPQPQSRREPAPLVLSMADIAKRNAAWERQVVQIRQSIQELYSREREAERQGNFTP